MLDPERKKEETSGFLKKSDTCLLTSADLCKIWKFLPILLFKDYSGSCSQRNNP